MGTREIPRVCTSVSVFVGREGGLGVFQGPGMIHSDILVGHIDIIMKSSFPNLQKNPPGVFHPASSPDDPKPFAWY